GLRDFYVAALKGALLSNNTALTLVDVTHQIKAYDIKEAAYTIRNAAKHFPKGTIHIVHVNTSDANTKLLVSEVEGHYYITFDSGLLSLAFEKTPHQTYQVNDELLENNSLLFEDAIGKVVNLLAKEYTLTDFGHIATETANFRLLQPIISQGSIRGTVINIDSFGNAVVNITRDMFTKFTEGRRFSVMANIGSTRVISQKFSEVDEGDMVCIFNSAGYLEIGINKGKAENLLGLKIDSPVLIMLD
ncbi:MAG TPA: SAM-dependent chlorinase/fluorinase, partial [Chitinophagales bacterium]|nr:SAM-dependent chlorinase/fluorinase [Chitinophagales bacterium]